jgi:hypothetical protein
MPLIGEVVSLLRAYLEQRKTTFRFAGAWHFERDPCTSYVRVVVYLDESGILSH